jgi:hypothetical protein
MLLPLGADVPTFGLLRLYRRATNLLWPVLLACVDKCD